MFCKNCGKEILGDKKFCPECGTPVQKEESAAPDDGATVVYTEESAAGSAVIETAGEAPVVTAMEPVAAAAVEVAAQEEPVLGRKKRGGAAIVVGLAVVAVVALVLAAVLLLPNLFGEKPVYFYKNDDGELFFLKNLSGKAEGKEVTDEDVSSVRISPDGKYVYFFEYNDKKDTYVLYRMKISDIGKKNAETEKIASGVSRYSLVLLESGEAIYQKDDDEIRVFDGKEDYKLVGECWDFSVDKDNRMVYYVVSNDDGTYTLYRIGISADSTKEKLIDDYTYTINGYTSYGSIGVLLYAVQEWTDGEATTTVYALKDGKKDKLVEYEGDGNIMLKEVSKDEIAFYYVVENREEVPLYDFVTDRLANEDKNVKKPSSSDYQTYSYWYGWTTDWDAYYDAYDEWEYAQWRNELREELKNYTYSLSSYTLCLYEKGKETEVVEDMSNSYPEYDTSTGLFLYHKFTGEVTKLADVADLDYTYELYDMITYSYSSNDETMYMNLGGKESEFEDAEDFTIYSIIHVSDKEVVLYGYEDGDSVLYSYEIKDGKLTRGDQISDDVGDYTVSYVDGEAELYYFEDVDYDDETGTLMCYKNGKSDTVAEDANRVDITEDGRVFMMDDASYDSRVETTVGTLYEIVNGKEKEISEDIYMYYVTYLGDGKAMFISDEDLCYWNGKEVIVLAKDVVNYWTNESIDSRTYSVY